MDLWAVANMIWVHGSSLYFQHQQISGLTKTFPTELRRLYQRSASLSFSLRYLGAVLREERLRVLDIDHNSSQDILQTVEEVTAALFETIYGIRNLRNIPEPGTWDTVKSYFGFSTLLGDWKMQKEHLMSSTNEISFILTNINHVVTASNAKKASEMCDRLGDLEKSIQRRTWLIGELFRWQTRGPKFIDRVDRSTAAESRTRAKAHVMNICNKNETYRWYKFLNDTTAVILVGDVANVDNIVAFAVWFAGNGEEAQFYQVDKARPFLTYPGKHRNEVKVFTSEQPKSQIGEMTLTFRNPNHAYNLRDLMENHRKLFAGHISSAKYRLRGATNQRYKPLADLSQSGGRGNITCIAELLEFSAPNIVQALQLWPHHSSGFAVGIYPIYIHKVSCETSYEVKSQNLKPHRAKVTKTKNGIGHLRGKVDRGCDELEGDFEIQFRSPDEAQEVYKLLTAGHISDDDDDD